MSQALPAETLQGYVPPSVTQFSVFLDQGVGRLLKLLQMFESDDADCQLCAFSVHEASDHAVVRVLTNHASSARAILRRNGLPFAELNLLVVELVGGLTLSQLCLHLLHAELSIRFAYPVLLRPNGTPTVAIAVDDLTLAGQVLRRKDFRLLGEGDLPKPGSCDDTRH
ncbi:MAG: acetolactate synthase [Planctomycetota bacterium]